MIDIRTFILAAATLVTLSCAKVHTVDVIPLPAEVNLTGKTVSLDKMKTLSFDDELSSEAAFLLDVVDKPLNVIDRKGDINLSLDNTLSQEEYTLSISKKSVRISGGSARAVFYGIQTLSQENTAYDGQLMTGEIKDAPRYSWRGYMLDESRHFFGEEYVRQTLDMMALYKLNKFHWHLTDAQGWRIEIKSFPLLTEVGAVGDIDGIEGRPAQFYTQDRIRAIIEYAAQRHIDVVPEIDMPGHGSSATRSYPVLSVGEAGSFTYNPGREAVYSFLFTVLDEVAALFPYEYLHIGGDEVFMGNGTWAEDPYIKALMQREGMTGIQEAEAYFIRRVSDYVDSLGKKIIAWDDVLELDSVHCATALDWWRQERPDHLLKGAGEGYQMILCPRLPLYFDFVQDTSHQCGRRKWGKDVVKCSVEDVYNFPDSLFGKTPVSEQAVLGLQANLWSEVIATPERAQFMTYPRMCALSESAWTSPERKDYVSFTSRLEHAYSLFDDLGINYYDYRDPGHHAEPLR